jgi:hypothetical protein
VVKAFIHKTRRQLMFALAGNAYASCREGQAGFAGKLSSFSVTAMAALLPGVLKPNCWV